MSDGGHDSADDTIALPALGCLELRMHPQRGRGVFTRKAISSGTLVNISPVLVFGRTEYADHGRHTQLDHYTYCWKDSGYALALGLGSMFNHEAFGHENVGFTRDMSRSLIRYTALRDIGAGEELCICYGPNVWFDAVSEVQAGSSDGHSGAQEQSADEFMHGFDLE
ncbi:hypothetical protein GGF37_005879 [Kickxella alabastrina]|nr:hypothetical protein GGF37_005879 [Kickxella alabastrina]